MAKKSALAVITVFVVWTGLDMCVHGYCLRDIYAATAELWRSHADMNMELMMAVRMVVALVFVLIYSRLVETQSIRSGLDYGLLWGLGTGAAMGFGSFAYMPIPLSLALNWFFLALVKSLVAGFFVGAIFSNKVRS